MFDSLALLAVLLSPVQTELFIDPFFQLLLPLQDLSGVLIVSLQLGLNLGQFAFSVSLGQRFLLAQEASQVLWVVALCGLECNRFAHLACKRA
jgi:hypothetical protein